MHASHLRIHDSVPFTEGNEGNQGSCSLFFVHLSPTESHWFLPPPFSRISRISRLLDKTMQFFPRETTGRSINRHGQIVAPPQASILV